MKAFASINIAALLAIAALVPAGAAAQDELTKEIEVQRTVELTHRDASRVALTPQLVLPTVKATPLSFSERTVNVNIPNRLAFLEPTAFADTLATANWPGFAAIGYFPTWNVAASAGYRILDNDRHRLNAWMQYDGAMYHEKRAVNPNYDTPYDALIRRNTITVGASYHVMVGKESEIDAGIDYTFSRFRTPCLDLTDDFGNGYKSLFNQNVNRLNVSTQWMSNFGIINYTGGIDYHYFGYVKGLNGYLWQNVSPTADLLEASRPARENVFNINAAAALPLNASSAAYLGVDLDVVSNNHHSYLSLPNDGTFAYQLNSEENGARYNHALLTLHPRYRLKTDNIMLTLGAGVQFTINSGKVFHISPDVNFAWTPSGIATVWAKATGGQVQNTLSSLYDVNYMTAPMLAYKNSNVTIDAVGGVKLFPLHGSYVSLYGGFARANSWLMPIGIDPNVWFAPTAFRGVNISGWRAGIELGYKYRDLGDAKISFETAPQSYGRGYYLWRDRAKYVAKAEVNAHPIEKLDVGVSYELRACRAMIDRTINADPDVLAYSYRQINLGNVSNLGINAEYHFTPQLSAFGQIDNLLNRQVLNLGLVQEQGITGLVGVSYKF